ncbi:ribonuclease H2, subunit B [Clohesyomyces aquaticus]|uniref:Ribonuclease H2 subunit B n=1 Tax=Clohesyomyces aquaticus TaxID=1231657 RepID=A0A1Y1Y3Z0_9PLEO|nr:ribonuclease H2, subunit B [Clohesyomyces aquaticus]
MARTRAKPVPKEASPEPTSPPPTKTLPPSTSNPPKLFILPRDTSKDARILTLDNPATANPSRYFFCPDKGFYEFTRISAPKQTPRSWLITPENGSRFNDSHEKEKEGEEVKDTDKDTALGSGYITSSPSLFIATPLDILFLLLPALSPASTKQKGHEKANFLSLEDHLEALTTSSPHLKSLLCAHTSLEATIAQRLMTCCDTVDAGDETMYRVSHLRVLECLVQKAERMVAKGLPKSLEDKFITPALEVPVMSIAREESSVSLATSTSFVSTTTATETETETMTTISTSTTEGNYTPALQTTTQILHLLRLRTALTYLLHSYIPAHLRTPLLSLLSTAASPSFPSFVPLESHLSAIAKLKSEAAALRSISDNISRKRGYEDDDEKAAEREEKKRKKEDEEKKKKQESRSIKQLKKVNTSGMSKLSSFFAVKPKTAK